MTRPYTLVYTHLNGPCDHTWPGPNCLTAQDFLHCDAKPDGCGSIWRKALEQTAAGCSKADRERQFITQITSECPTQGQTMQWVYSQIKHMHTEYSRHTMKCMPKHWRTFHNYVLWKAVPMSEPYSLAYSLHLNELKESFWKPVIIKVKELFYKIEHENNIHYYIILVLSII